MGRLWQRASVTPKLASKCSPHGPESCPRRSALAFRPQCVLTTASRWGQVHTARQVKGSHSCACRQVVIGADLQSPLPAGLSHVSCSHKALAVARAAALAGSSTSAGKHLMAHACCARSRRPLFAIACLVHKALSPARRRRWRPGGLVMSL